MTKMLMGLVLLAGLQAKADDLATIKNISGCFNVSYRFVENGANDTTIVGDFYEWVAWKPTDKGAEMPHYGQQGTEAQKHWSETWTPNADGTWSQVIKGPAGDYRYTCTGKFVFNQFNCFYPNAPKPRRDSGRTDYKRLDRTITLQITPKGWIQAENNLKKDDKGNPVANEVGWNQYDRVDDTKCAPAQQEEKDDEGGK